jgi:tetratricopeptide (TPR) repeat protein
VVIILLLILAAVVIIKKKKEKQNAPMQEIEKITKKLEKKKVPKDEIRQLIKKATILYQKGQKQKALELLNKLSAYSEALSYYNLGVIKLQEKNYKKALEYFQKAIKNKDNRTLSAINATYASLMLKNKKLFNYYRNLAYTFLPEISKLKSYPYYYAVVMYYMGYEYEAIPALKHSTLYKDESNRLLSAIYEYYNNFTNAQEIEEDPFYKGLSLAEIGEYSLAKNYLGMSQKPQAKFALALVDLKTSYFKEAARIFKQMQNNNIYPITMYLKKSLFDIKVAQKNFAQTFLKKKEDYYDLFFYFAPYKVFNMNQTISYLKKGIAGIPIGAIQESQTYLSKSATYSALNLKISKALKLALNGHIYLANKEFKKLIKKRDTSYILHYDLGLTYAQLGDYQNAYKHLLRAYHLNPNDLYSGIYAVMALGKMEKTNNYLVSSIKEDLDDNKTLADAMLAITQNNTVKMAAFAEKDEKNQPLWILTKIVSKAILGNDYSYEALKLKSIYPKDIIANLLYFYANNKNLPVNKIALNFQSLFFSKDWRMNDFYYGANIVKNWYFTFTKISGLLNKVRLDLLDAAKKETFDLIPILKRLAFADLYTKHFEESYVIYNDLINNKNISDPDTLYQAAVSAVGANHHANGVALMELAKLKNPNYYEARYGLGLLWQEANNLRAASIQYSKIPDGFVSRFFDFNIKPPK